MKYSCLAIIGFLCLLLSMQKSIAQTYALNNGFTFNQTITTCAGIFYDANINANYGISEDYTVTFKSGSVGKVLQFNFEELVIAAGDYLVVYDGPSNSNAVIDSFTNVSITSSYSIFASDTNSTGCVTFRFKSDDASQAAGWKATIKCGFPCRQKIIGAITTTPNKDVNGFTNICINGNGRVVFDLTTQYPDNELVYHQADTSSKFHWFFGDGKDTIAKNLTNVAHTYLQEGGYNVRVIVADSNGCSNRLPINTKIRTGIKPLFRISAPTTICVNDSVKLSPSSTINPGSGGIVTTQEGSFFTLPVSGDSLFLPDGSGVTYSSNISINQFLQGQTLTNLNDLRGIFINMEHSYLGDLNISITAPNGVTVNLKNYPGGAGAYLGEPVDEDSPAPTNNALSSVAGKGYTYVFNNLPTYGTMAAEANSHTYTFVDNAGRTQSNKKYLPAGSYASASSLTDLVGTPLNGVWTLKVRDNLAIDNGFLFNWKLDFNPALFPSVETYDVPIVSQTWVSPASGLVNVNGTLATIKPEFAGNLNYIFRVTDGYGCTFDSTIKLQAIAAPTKPNLGNDVAFCNGQTSLNLTVSNPDNTAFYTWNNASNGVAIAVNAVGTYIVTANNSAGCVAKDTIQVNASEALTVNLGIDTAFCASNHNLLKPIVSNNVVSYLWNNGTTKDTLRITSAGTYSVKVFTSNGCNLTDEIIITDNPVNNFTMPIDTVICENSSFLFTLSPPANTSIIWNDGFTGFSKILSATNVYTTIANNKGCLKQNSYKINSKPLPIFSLGADLLLCNSKTVLLKAFYPGATYLWNDNSTDSSLFVTNEKTYWAEALLNECKFRDSITIRYKKCDCNTVVPNAFSPNGDGINDLFLTKMDCVPTQFNIVVFNRNGQPVFETKNYTQPWDGKINGKNAPIGTYYYIINYINPGLAIPERFTGSITILR